MEHAPRPDESPRVEGLRAVVVGKGGAGKSTLTAMLARTLARRGAHVVAVDADEQRNLGATLGVSFESLARITPLALDADYIEEKTGARPGEGSGAMLRLNPDTSDVVERRAVAAPDGIRLLVMGGVQRAGGGCLCPETSLLAATIANMRLRRGEIVLMDTHAGVEHFGRSLALGFDRALVVVEPTFNSVQVGLETARLAAELGITEISLLVNRCRDHGDFSRALGYVADHHGVTFSSVHELPDDPSLRVSDPSIDAALEHSALARALMGLVESLLDDHPDTVSVGAGVGGD